MNQQDLSDTIDIDALPISRMAILSLITGIMGIFVLPVIASAIAVYTGYSARQETRSAPPRATGDGMATVGIFLGWMGTALTALAFCALVAYLVFSGQDPLTVLNEAINEVIKGGR
jgi:hypothetical protein